MVDQFESCEFWLPPEFLNDDDFAVKKNGFDLFSGFGSSATNSEMGSRTESESDEDECFTGLASKMEKIIIEDSSDKACRLPSSPKSPLCKDGAEFTRRKMVEESTGLLPTRNEFFVPMKQQGMNFGFPTNPPPQLSYQQLQVLRYLQFEQFRRYQMMNQTQQNRGVKNGERIPMGLPVSAWPPLQRSQPKPQPGTGMRAVYLGTNLAGAKKQRAGTGVFLPRTVSSTGNRKSRPACTPALIPDRVVHALNLNLETLGVQNQAHRHPGFHTNNGFSADYVKNRASLKYNDKNDKNRVTVQQKQSIAKAGLENQEAIRLPQEWTY
ncbi:hypothetical protein Leryth_011137 [Lithospermum erythrorhizon]|nr:hypothetical protein Leryth_011137 [Lithospermum erythrorhizon]